MPVKKKARKKRRKIRYRMVKLKLTAQQHDSLDYYCNKRNTTPNKLIKRLIKPYFKYRQTPEENFATPNQLDLFELHEQKV
jgi:hypothetical protein